MVQIKNASVTESQDSNHESLTAPAIKAEGFLKAIERMNSDVRELECHLQDISTDVSKTLIYTIESNGERLLSDSELDKIDRELSNSEDLINILILDSEWTRRNLQAVKKLLSQKKE